MGGGWGGEHFIHLIHFIHSINFIHFIHLIHIVHFTTQIKHFTQIVHFVPNVGRCDIAVISKILLTDCQIPPPSHYA